MFLPQQLKTEVRDPAGQALPDRALLFLIFTLVYLCIGDRDVCVPVYFVMLHHLSSAAKVEILFVQTFCTLFHPSPLTLPTIAHDVAVVAVAPKRN